MKKIDIYDIDVYQGFIGDYDSSIDEIKEYNDKFVEEFDIDIFINRYKSRSEQFKREGLTYKEIMIGCYDVLDEKQALDWILARNIFIDLVENGVFIELENGRFKLNKERLL